MEFSKYIVPIYSNNDFSGTGFIIGGLLITANHVVSNKINSYFIFEGKRCKIDLTRLVALEFPDDYSNPNYAYDLFVCKTDIRDSSLTLSAEYNKSEACHFYAYSYNEDTRSIVIDQARDLNINHNNAWTNHYGKIIPLYNCISCYCELNPGNSGGPLFQNGIIIGMLLQGNLYHEKCIECKFLKGSYIKEAIERVNNNHK